MEKVKAILKSRTLEELVKDFEATETTNDINIYQVRGWLMDEIQKRNPTGYEKWLDSENCEDSELKNYIL